MAETVENATLTSDMFFRRLEEKPDFFGIPVNLDPMWWQAYWLIFGGVLVVLALAFIYWVYTKDGKAVGGWWAIFLVGFRTLTIASLFYIWLLPARKEKYRIIEHSRVVWLFDISNSLHESDDDVSDTPNRETLTRQDEVLRFLNPEDSDSSSRPIVERLTAKNPVYFYRFGSILDPNGWHVPLHGENPSRDEWVRRLEPAGTGSLAEPVRLDVVEQYAKAGESLEQAIAELEGTARELKTKDAAVMLSGQLNDLARVRDNVLNRTNYGKSVLDAIARESGKQVQAVVIVGDGRSNEGSIQDLAAISAEAKNRSIPVMTIGVGKPTTTVNVKMVDIRAPGRIQPEDDFPVSVLVSGENYTGEPVRVFLHVKKPGELVPHTEVATVRLTDVGGVQSTGRAEFPILKEGNKPWTKGKFEFTAEVWAPGPGPQDRKRIEKERVIADNKIEQPKITEVDDRKFSILLMAGAPMREYQYLRTHLVREKEKFDTYLYYQPYKKGTVQDLDEKFMLVEGEKPKFPDKLDARDTDKFNLGNYDIIVAFDVDWSNTYFNRDQLEKIKRWNQEFGGGFIFVAGPGSVNTYETARNKNAAPIHELLPVVLDKTAGAIKWLDRKSDKPYALNWDRSATSFEPFNLTDNTEKPSEADGRVPFLEGFEDFFWRPLGFDGKLDGAEIQRKNWKTPLSEAKDVAKRGFFSTYPVSDVKPGGVTVLAYYADQDERYHTDKNGPLRGQQQPYFVMGAPENRKGTVFFMGSGEIWRMRSYNEKFHERFWIKLLRFVGKGDMAAGTRRGTLIVGSRYAEGDNAEIEVEIRNKDMTPYTQADKIHVKIATTAPIPDENLKKRWLEVGEELKSQAGVGRPGWFSGVFRVPLAGKYELSVAIPGSNDTLTESFEARASDVEREKKLPDFALLHRLASESASLPDQKRRHPDLNPAMDRSRRVMREQAADAPQGMITLTPDNDHDRLFFTTEQASLIPELIDANPEERTLDGKTTDLWDKGIGAIWMDHPEQADPKYMTEGEWLNNFGRAVPWALLLVTLTLSTEWLTRKLLRLA